MKSRAGLLIKSLIVAMSLALGTVIFVTAHPRSAQLPGVRLLRTPGGGIQPQTARGPDGTLHMIYFRGDPGAGNIEYVHRRPGAEKFSKPIRVNSQPKSAVAVGTVRGPQMAVGRNGRAYVVWFGSDQAEPRGPEGTTPVLFSRLNDTGTSFEAQRCVMQYAEGVDGGLSVAADQAGDVYVVWHAAGNEPGEAHRRVYLARSRDDGKTFAREVAISPASLGACGCCGMRAFTDSRGNLFVFYRAAAESIHRDMTLLVSRDRGRTFLSRRVAAWHLNACPMSTAYLAANGHRTLAAWQTAEQVYFDEISPQPLRLSSAIQAPGKAEDRKHPALAADSQGQVLLAWTEGTGWQQGGSLAWQLFDRTGNPLGPEGRAPGVPVWGLPSVFVDRQGNFTIVY